MRARDVFGGLAAVVGFYAASVGLALVAATPIPRAWTDGPWGLAIGQLPLVAGTLAIGWVFIGRGWASWRLCGWRGPRPDLRAFLAGLGVGIGMAAVALALAIAVGGARIALSGERLSAYMEVAGPLAVGIVVAALAEELLVRGFPLARLAQPLGRVGASLALMVVFAALHLPNPSVSALGLVNIGIASLVLSAAFFTPGGLPMAWGVHVGWNGGLALGADAPVSGLEFRLPVLEFSTGARQWVTGGPFGPEGGVAATVVMLIALFWLSRWVAQAGKGGGT